MVNEAECRRGWLDYERERLAELEELLLLVDGE